MITYTCDICGCLMPPEYVRKAVDRRGRETLASVAGVDDVCPLCAEAGKHIDVGAVVRAAWKEACHTRIATTSVDQIKRDVTERLKAYRQANGLGCLAPLAEQIHDPSVTDDSLRAVLVGSGVLPDTSWYKIARGLDQLEINR